MGRHLTFCGPPPSCVLQHQQEILFLLTAKGTLSKQTSSHTTLNGRVIMMIINPKSAMEGDQRSLSSHLNHTVDRNHEKTLVNDIKNTRKRNLQHLHDPFNVAAETKRRRLDRQVRFHENVVVVTYLAVAGSPNNCNDKQDDNDQDAEEDALVSSSTSSWYNQKDYARFRAEAHAAMVQVQQDKSFVKRVQELYNAATAQAFWSLVSSTDSDTDSDSDNASSSSSPLPVPHPQEKEPWKSLYAPDDDSRQFCGLELLAVASIAWDSRERKGRLQERVRQHTLLEQQQEEDQEQDEILSRASREIALVSTLFCHYVACAQHGF